MVRLALCDSRIALPFVALSRSKDHATHHRPSGPPLSNLFLTPGAACLGILVMPCRLERHFHRLLLSKLRVPRNSSSSPGRLHSIRTACLSGLIIPSGQLTELMYLLSLNQLKYPYCTSTLCWEYESMIILLRSSLAQNTLCQASLTRRLRTWPSCTSTSTEY